MKPLKKGFLYMEKVSPQNFWQLWERGRLPDGMVSSTAATSQKNMWYLGGHEKHSFLVIFGDASIAACLRNGPSYLLIFGVVFWSMDGVGGACRCGEPSMPGMLKSLRGR